MFEKEEAKNFGQSSRSIVCIPTFAVKLLFDSTINKTAQNIHLVCVSMIEQ